MKKKMIKKVSKINKVKKKVVTKKKVVAKKKVVVKKKVAPKKVLKKVVKKIIKLKVNVKTPKREQEKTSIFDRNAFKKMMGEAISYSKAEHIEIYCQVEDSQATRFSDNSISQNLAQKDFRIVICSYIGNKIGKVEVNSWDSEVIRKAVSDSEEIASLLPDDPEFMPPLSKEDGQSKLKSVLTAKEIESFLTYDQITDKIKAGIKLCAKSKGKFAGSYKHIRGQEAFMNSKGLFTHGYFSTVDWMNIVVMPGGESGYAHSVNHSPKKIDFLETSKRAFQIAKLAQNPIDVTPGKYEVILSPEAADELLLYAFYAGMDAKSCDEGLTYLRGQKGKEVFGKNINVTSNPYDKIVPTSHFGANGIPLKPERWIEKGVIKNLVYSRYWAKKNRTEVTPFPGNLIMEGNDKRTLEEMIKSTKEGILVTRLWYIRFVDPMIPSVTGMTRDGTFLIKNGKIVAAIKNMRFNDNLVRIFKSVVDLGKREITGEFSKSYIPAMKVTDFSFTSKTNF